MAIQLDTRQVFTGNVQELFEMTRNDTSRF